MFDIFRENNPVAFGLFFLSYCAGHRTVLGRSGDGGYVCFVQNFNAPTLFL